MNSSDKDDKIFDDDPMRESFLDENFNSYKTGPGADLPLSFHVNSRRVDGENVKIFIANIDVDLELVGLKNIFSNYGKILDAYFHGDNRNRKTKKTGIVVYSKFLEAKTAVERLNRVPPFYFVVRFSRSERAVEKSELNDDEKLISGSESNVERLERVRSRRSDQSSRDGQVETSVDPIPGELSEWTSPWKFRSGLFDPPNDSRIVVLNNAIFGTAATIYRKSQKAYMGFSEYVPRSQPTKSPYSKDSDVILDSNGIYRKGVGSRRLSDKLGFCKKCGFIATNVCESCKVFYCSMTCFKDDFPLHKSCSELCSENPTTDSSIEKLSVNSVDFNEFGRFRLKGISVENYYVPEKGIYPPQLMKDAWINNSSGDLKNADRRGTLEGYEKHTIVFKEYPDTYWVTKTMDDVKAIHLSILSLSSSSNCVGALKIGGIYGYEFGGVWRRALIVSLNPLRLSFVDYGNEGTFDKNIRLIELTPDLKYLEPMAFRVVLQEGHPDNYLDKTEGSEIEFKVIRPINKMTSLIRVIDSQMNEEVKPEESPRDLNLFSTPRKRNQTLNAVNMSSAVTVQVKKVLGNDSVSGTIIADGPGCRSNVDISLILEKSAFIPKDKGPGCDVTARLGSSLHRGYVVNKEEESVSVALVDYGQIVTLTEVSDLPEEVKDIPENSVRVVFDQPMSDDDVAGLVGKILKFEEIKSDADVLTARSEQYGSVRLQPWEAMIEEIGLRAYEISSGSEVIITAVSASDSVYVQPVCLADQFELMTQDLTSYCLQEKPMTRKPLCNELVASRSKVIDGMYYRALVLGRNDGKYRVTYIDYGHVDEVPLEHFKELTSYFKIIPSFAIRIGLKNASCSTLNLKAIKLFNEYSITGEIYTAIFEETNLGRVELKNVRSHVSLNEEVSQVTRPSWLKNPRALFKASPFMATDLKFDPWPRDKFVTVQVIDAKSFNRAFCFLIDETEAKEFVTSEFFTQKMSGYASTAQRYLPRKTEICLALCNLRDSAKWCRALCTAIVNDLIQVLFIDYGRGAIVSPDEIRKMPSEFMEPPASIQQCTLIGDFRSDEMSREVKIAIAEQLSGAVVSDCQVVDEDGLGNAVLKTNWIDNCLPELKLRVSGESQL